MFIRLGTIYVFYILFTKNYAFSQSSKVTLCCPIGYSLDDKLVCEKLEENRTKAIEKITSIKNIQWESFNERGVFFTTFSEPFIWNSTVIKDIPNYCIDFLKDAENIIQFIPYEKLQDLISKVKVSACCSANEIFDTQSNKCVAVNSKNVVSFPLRLPDNAGFTHIEENTEKLSVKRPLCDQKDKEHLYLNEYCIKDIDCYFNKIPTFDIDSKGSLTITKPNELQERIAGNNFCLSATKEGTTVAEVCRKDCTKFSCVSKCCPKGEELNADHSCSVSKKVTSLPTPVKTLKGKILANSSDLMEIRSGYPLCTIGIITLDSTVGPIKTDMWLLKNGSLVFARFDTSKLYNTYCIDFLKTDGKPSKVIALVCAMEDMFKSAPRGHHETLAVVLVISSLFYGITIIVHLLLPELRNLHGYTVMFQSLCLMVQFIIMSQLKLDENSTGSCTKSGVVIAVIGYYLFEAAFVWLAIMGFDVYIALSGSTIGSYRRRTNYRFLVVYSLIAWGLSAIIVVTAVLIDTSDAPYYIIRPYFGVTSCWFYDHKKILAAYLYGPACIFLVLNLCFFFLLARKLYLASRNSLRLSPGEEGKGKER
ncbi:probable G-protein coupled receptor Mth-like 11 isoform X2 [Artemia franciscana]